jgi:hypothetical protein
MDTQKRPDEHERRLARVEKNLDATAKLLKVGMRLFLDFRNQQKEANETFNYKLNALIDAQHRNDERFRESDELFRKSDERFRESDELFRKSDERFRKSDELFRKNDERFRKNDEKFDRLIERLGRKNPNGHSS